jgi:predicted Rossmann fold flavoprotein
MKTGTQSFDVIILGAGGAGLMCAIQAAQRGRKVALLDHASKVGGKILISGGGRCNFTNTGATPSNYVCENPHFSKSALSRFQPSDFISLVQKHGIAFHEKKLGQLFCDDSAVAIVDLLLSEVRESGAEIFLGCKINNVEKSEQRFSVETSSGVFASESLVVATGGLSIPKLGATGLGYQIAEKFGLKQIIKAPALDGFVFGQKQASELGGLAGLSIDVLIQVNAADQRGSAKKFRENILFTHAGLSGPAALQASLHWYPGDTVEVNLSPEQDVLSRLQAKRKEGSRAEMKNLLSEFLPRRFAERFCEVHFTSTLPLAQISDKALEEVSEKIHHWKFVPAGTVGYSKAEVTRGGVDTDELSSKTMESRRVPGLFFIGEVLDVTGWLGGYNFQWAWASGWAAGQAV